uniref:Uncharacterized protein n=1 Tax=Callithrix jacchus TaxID=9483 RepID=A0A8I3VX47_CALJA
SFLWLFGILKTLSHLSQGSRNLDEVDTKGQPLMPPARFNGGGSARSPVLLGLSHCARPEIRVSFPKHETSNNINVYGVEPGDKSGAPFGGPRQGHSAAGGTRLRRKGNSNIGKMLGHLKPKFEKFKQVSSDSIIYIPFGLVMALLKTHLYNGAYQQADSFSASLRCPILLALLVLITLVLLLFPLHLQLLLLNNKADTWDIAMTYLSIRCVCVRILVNSLQPLPSSYTFTSAIYTAHSYPPSTFLPSVNMLLYILFLLLYSIEKSFLLHSKAKTDTTARKCIALNTYNRHTRLVRKTLYIICPESSKLVFSRDLWLLSLWTMKSCQRYHDSLDSTSDFLSGLCLAQVLFLTDSHSLFVPSSNVGKKIVFINGKMGTGMTTVLEVIVSKKLRIKKAEKSIANFTEDTKHVKKKENGAFSILKEIYLIKKKKNIVKKADLEQLNNHQRK